jgi:nucleotide-binding universal stress UspA family protein
MYERILLPTDGSRGMASAIAHGLQLARRHDAEVHVLYVVDVRSYALLPESTRDRVRGLLAEEGEAAVEGIQRLVEGSEEPVELVPAVVEGVPHEVIIDYADDEEIDLIVMGTHGASGEERRLVVSVAEEVVRQEETPVMVVRMREADLAAVEEAIPEEQRRYIA